MYHLSIPNRREERLMNIEFMHPAEQICTVMKRIYDRGLTTLSGGNLSIRDEDGSIWVSPSGIDKSSLTPADVVKINADGSFEGKHKPTSEYLIHKEIYQVRKDIKAILHAHPPAMTSMSCLHDAADTSLYPVTQAMNSDIAVAVYALPGSMDLARKVADVFAGGSNTAVLENHGVFMSSNENIFEVYKRFDELETNALIEMNAYVFGTPKGLTEKEFSMYKELTHVVPEKGDSGQPVSSQEKLIRKELAETVNRAYRCKLFTAYSGVASARIDEKSFLVSPLKRDNAYIEPQEFVRITDGRYEGEAEPDGLWKYMSKVYEAKPEINGIICATPPYTMMFMVTEEPYRVNFIPESYGVLFDCRTYTIEDLAKKPEKLIEEAQWNHPFAAVKNAGIALTAASLHSAYDMMEVCENAAKSIWMAKVTKREIKWMTDQQMKEMDEK